MTLTLLLILHLPLCSTQYDPELLQSVVPGNLIMEKLRLFVRKPKKSEELVPNAEFSDAFALFNDTDKLMMMLKKDKEMLAQTTSDNDNEVKYTFSVIQNFYLEFIKIYTKLEENGHRADCGGDFDNAFDMALQNTRNKNNYVALQFSASVRRVFYILSAIVGSLVEIIQMLCAPDLDGWKCGARYYIMLADEYFNCQNIWHYHHRVLVEWLKLIGNYHTSLLDVTEEMLSVINMVLSGESFASVIHRLNSKGTAPTTYLELGLYHVRHPLRPVNTNPGAFETVLVKTTGLTDGVGLGALVTTELRDSDQKLGNDLPSFANMQSAIIGPSEKDFRSATIMNSSRRSTGLRTKLMDSKLETVKSSSDVSSLEPAADETKRILFNVTMRCLMLFRPVLKKHLLERAKIYKIITAYQSKGKLECIHIDRISE